MAAQLPKDGEYTYIKLKIVGGEIPGTSLVQKIGPMGIPPKVVGEDCKKMTESFKSIKVCVILKIKDRKAEVSVSPGTSSLILKALREGPRDRKKVKNVTHHGSITMTDVIDIARIKAPTSCAKNLSGVVKEILGTCVSIGCKIEGKTPKEVIKEINEGELILPVK